MEPLDFDTNDSIFSGAIKLAEREEDHSVLSSLLFDQRLTPLNVNHKIYVVLFYYKRGLRSWSFLLWLQYQADDVFFKLFKRLHPDLNEILKKHYQHLINPIPRRNNGTGKNYNRKSD